MINENDMSKVGERFVHDNYPLLFREQVVKCRMNTEIPGRDRTEGADLEIWAVFTTKHEGQWTDYPEELAEETKYWTIDRMIKGPVEVKTCSFNQYVARNDCKFNYDCGVIQFAIWNSNNLNNKPERKRKRLGSLYRMFYPSDADHERRPLSYVVVLLNMEMKPYACLVFEDFQALKDRLIEIGRRCGLDLTEEGFRNIPCWENLNGWKSPDEWADMKMAENPELHLMKNMWYIKMSEVIDLANVVMIGRTPEIRATVNNCSVWLQKKRLDFLTKRSWKTIPLITDRRTKEIIYRRNQIFGIIKTLPWVNDRTTGNEEIRLTTPPD